MSIIDINGLNIGGGRYTFSLEQDDNTFNRIYIECEPIACYYGFTRSGAQVNPNSSIFTSPIIKVVSSEAWNNISFLISITAEFPEEDTGYIEEGYQFCVQPGANLLSFPCDNPISVNQSLPQGAENFITEIVGQGVAASYNPALGWIGNLAEFTPGSGYWFKSNESLCFEYDCVED